MKIKVRKLISIALVMLMCLALMPAIASAAGHMNNVIDISLLDGNNLIGVYTNWDYQYDGYNTEIFVTNDVTVVGSATNIGGNFNINIASGKTVRWEAQFYQATGDASAFIGLSNEGVFEVVTGAIISTAQSNAVDSSSAIYFPNYGNATLIISGGIVTSNHVYRTIENINASNTIIINSGLVNNTGSGKAIETNGTVALSGGTVSATTGVAIEASYIDVTGTASVRSNPGATAIKSNWLSANVATGILTVTGNVEVTDGKVWASFDGEITITGNVECVANTWPAGIGTGDSGTNDSAKVTIIGDVSFSGTNGKYIEAHDGGITYVTGSITGNPVIYVDTKTLTLGTPTTANGLSYQGYFWDVYTDDSKTPQSYVYVRQGVINPVAPTITGPTTMSLTVGYAATSTGAYTFAGNPDPGVSMSGNPAIRWNETTLCLDIAAGLAAGTYPVVLTASNGVLPNATLTFTLTVNSSGGGGYTSGGGGGVSSYSVSFNTNGGSAITSRNVNAGAKLTAPTNPTKQGYTFDGWYTDAALKSAYDFDKAVFSSFTLYAKWAAGSTGSIIVKLSIGSASYTVNGVTKTMDVKPYIVDGRTMVPLRFIAEALGAKVDWNGDTETATVTLDGKVLSVKIGALAPGMDVPAVIKDSRTMVPLRYLGEALGCKLEWNPDTGTIVITK